MLPGFDGGRLLALRPLGQVGLNHLTVLKGLEAIHVDGREVGEEVFVTIVGSDEPESLRVVEPLNRSRTARPTCPPSSARDGQGNPLRDFPKIPIRLKSRQSTGGVSDGLRVEPTSWAASPCAAAVVALSGVIWVKGRILASHGRLQSIAFRCAGVSAPRSRPGSPPGFAALGKHVATTLALYARSAQPLTTLLIRRGTSRALRDVTI